MTVGHRCYREREMRTLTGNVTAAMAGQRELDVALHGALLEIEQEVGALGANFHDAFDATKAEITTKLSEMQGRNDRQIRGLHAKIGKLARSLGARPPRLAGRNGRG